MRLEQEDILQRALVDEALPIREAAAKAGVSVSAAYRYAGRTCLPTNSDTKAANLRLRHLIATSGLPLEVVAAYTRTSIVTVRRVKEELDGGGTPAQPEPAAG